MGAAHERRGNSFPLWGKAGIGASTAQALFSAVRAPTPTLPQGGREQSPSDGAATWQP